MTCDKTVVFSGYSAKGKFEGTKGVINIIRRTDNTMGKRKRTNNDLQYITQKTSFVSRVQKNDTTDSLVKCSKYEEPNLLLLHIYLGANINLIVFGFTPPGSNLTVYQTICNTSLKRIMIHISKSLNK